MHFKNAVTLLTPPGPAAIAVVRLAGPAVRAFLDCHFSRPARCGRCVHGTLRDERGDVLDDPVVVLAPAGDFADVSVHGGAWVVQSVVDLAERAGFTRTKVPRPAAHPGGNRHPEGAAPTEGSRDAKGVLASEIPSVAADPVGMPGSGTGALTDLVDELEREVLDYLPLARTELALRALLAQPAAWAALQTRVVAGPAQDVAREIRGILEDRSLCHLLHPPRVAIVGAANVGKSTLANQLFAQERSITADVPGTTRDWVGEIANVDGLAVMLLDTPGVRETADALEREAIARSRAEVRAADLVVLVLDVTRPMEPEQGPLRRAYPEALTVVNKVDRPAAWASVGAPDSIHTAASTGQGVDRLRHVLRRRFGCLNLDVARPRAWTERQRAQLWRALDDPRRVREI